MRQAILILLLAIGAAVAYGLVHDQVTIRVCPEYFTIAHPKIIESTSLTLIALAWGVVATWWMGAGLGLLLAIGARAGSEPRLGARQLAVPIIILLGVMAGGALGSGIVGYVLASTGRVGLTGELAANVPEAHHVRFMSAWFAHTASYAVGAIGGVLLTLWTVVSRWRASRRGDSRIEALPVTGS